jgi:hypothetical protein
MAASAVWARPAPARRRSAPSAPPFGGMLAASCLGIFVIPGLYVLFQTLRERLKELPERLAARKRAKV